MGLSKAKCRQIAAEVVDRLEKEYPRVVLGMIRQILADRVPKPKGRRVEADWEALLEMTRLLRDGGAKSVRAASRMVSDKVEGTSPEAIVDRLRSAYREYKEELLEELAEEDPVARAVAARRAADIKRAFEEGIEPWDL